jgi:serine/threonine-protein kinase HipA
MADIEVHIDIEGRTRPICFARSNRARGSETVTLEYVPDGWPIPTASRSSRRLP